MPIKYTFVKIYRRKEFAHNRKKKLEKVGYRVRVLVEVLRSGKHQYVVYRSRVKR